MYNQKGFTLITLIFVILVIGISLGGAGTMWSTAAKREKEKELLFRGDAIKRAIGSYYNFTNNREYPRRLDDLLKDPRSFTAKRHLRKVYLDVMSKDGEWELILHDIGGIKGVRSKSMDEPLKRANFPDGCQAFEAASTYNDWKFIFDVIATGSSLRPGSKPKVSTETGITS